MKRITVYKPVELKRNNPAAFEHALEAWQERTAGDDIPWGDETIESLKATFKASGIHLANWELGAYAYSFVTFDMGDAGALSGPRVEAWLENNLLGKLRIRNNHGTERVADYDKPLQNLRWNASYRFGPDGNPGVRPYTIGHVPPCPFTGYCHDDDLLEALQAEVRKGSTLQEAYVGLADVSRKALEAEYDYARSEEAFLEQELELTKDGRII